MLSYVPDQLRLVFPQVQKVVSVLRGSSLNLGEGGICWICGDLMISLEALSTWSEPGECVEADDGYVEEAPLRVKFLESMTEPAEKEAMAK